MLVPPVSFVRLGDRLLPCLFLSSFYRRFFIFVLPLVEPFFYSLGRQLVYIFLFGV